jgi:hypothetical protein
VQLTSVVGLPADSVARGQFLAAFRGEFAAVDVPIERLTLAGDWAAGGSATNHFRLIEDASDDAWTMQVVIGAPPPLKLPARKGQKSSRTAASRRTSRGMIAAFTLRSPSTDVPEPHSASARIAFAFPASPVAAGASLGVPATGYAFPWSDAGRAAGRLALEALHHESGDLAAEERCAIAPAVRTEAGR